MKWTPEPETAIIKKKGSAVMQNGAKYGTATKTKQEANTVRGWSNGTSRKQMMNAENTADGKHA